MGTTRRRILRSAGPVIGLSISGCSGDTGRTPGDQRPTPDGYSQQTTNPERATGRPTDASVSRPAVELLEDDTVKNSSTGQTVEYSSWLSSVVVDAGIPRLNAVVHGRSGVDKREYRVGHRADEGYFLVDVLVPGPPDGVQELAVPKYFDVKENAPHVLRILIRTGDGTVSEPVPVYARAVLDPRPSTSGHREAPRVGHRSGTERF